MNTIKTAAGQVKDTYRDCKQNSRDFRRTEKPLVNLLETIKKKESTNDRRN